MREICTQHFKKYLLCKLIFENCLANSSTLCCLVYVVYEPASVLSPSGCGFPGGPFQNRHRLSGTKLEDAWKAYNHLSPVQVYVRCAFVFGQTSSSKAS